VFVYSVSSVSAIGIAHAVVRRTGHDSFDGLLRVLVGRARAHEIARDVAELCWVGVTPAVAARGGGIRLGAADALGRAGRLQDFAAAAALVPHVVGEKGIGGGATTGSQQRCPPRFYAGSR